MMIKEAIIRLSQKQDLSYDEAEQVMNEIMEGKATDVQMSAYLTALSLKGETIDEITASAAGMRAHCIKLLHNMDVLEIVGTGGDGANSFNISTTASLVIAAAGFRWQNTATGRRHPDPERQTYWRRWGLRLIFRRSAAPSC